MYGRGIQAKAERALAHTESHRRLCELLAEVEEAKAKK